jgi:hypothetical protein
MAPLEMTTSTDASGSGMASISPGWNSHQAAVPASLAASSARAHISGRRSTPIARPVSPTAWAARMVSMPPPLPTSSTVSPALSAARGTGLPTPSAQSIARSGTRASWSSV